MAALAACASPSPSPSESESAAAQQQALAISAAWTDAFEAEAVLVARQVSIEGPPGLLLHLALEQNPEDYDFKAEATEEGFLQQARVKRELGDSATGTWPPLRVQLDNLTIAVSHSVRVLERPDVCDVIVAARGEVMWKCLSPVQEKRGGSLRLVGPVEE